MPKSIHFAQVVHQKGKTLLLIQSKHDSHENRVGSGHNLSDDRSHKVQYGDPIIEHFAISMDDP